MLKWQSQIYSMYMLDPDTLDDQISDMLNGDPNDGEGDDPEQMIPKGFEDYGLDTDTE